MILPNFKKAYVWQFPVRFFHWTNAACITVLVVTGLIIANPPGIMSDKEAAQQFWFGWVRIIHFVAAYVFIGVMIWRLYWAFSKTVNQFASWKAFVPFLSRKGWLQMWYTIRGEILLQKPRKGEELPIMGHNAVAVTTYVIMLFLALVMIATGFALYEPNASWFLPKMFKWVVPLSGGDYNVRLIHHLVMWLIIILTVIHIYLVLFTDWVEGMGEASSMVSGFKYVENERLKES